jgi:D-glucosaminate-6-phosphate ammonia-lyase
MSIYQKLGVKRVVNAGFLFTRLGGSTLHPTVLAAMEEANENWAPMWDLIKRGGEIIAEACGAEAGWITSGAFNALVLASAAAMAGKDPEKMRRLPHSENMKNEIIIQRANRLYLYDRSMEVPGGHFVQVGDESWGCTPELMEQAINEKTAAIHHVLTGRLRPGVLSVEETIKIAHRHGVPVILDIAGMTYPTEILSKYVKMGVDVACYGGKYVGGPNSTGFCIGKKDMIEAIALHSFIGSEAGPNDMGGFYRSIGRGYKLDRQEVVGLLTAFQRWTTMDHEKERLQPAWDRAHYILNGLKQIPGLSDAQISLNPRSGKGVNYHVIAVQMTWPEKSPAEVKDITLKLQEDDPMVYVRGGRSNSFNLNCLTLNPGEEEIVVERFKKIFG